MGHVCGIKDEVEGECPGFMPVFLARGNEMLRAKLLGIGFLTGGVRDGVGFRTER